MSRMQWMGSALLCALMAPGVLAAQAPPEEEAVDESADAGLEGEGAEVAEPYVEPEPVVTQAPPPPPPVAAVVVEEEPDESKVEWLPGTRPGTSFGIGFGWVFPEADLALPNTVTMRFRFPSGLTIEPNLTIAGSGVSDNNDLTEDPSSFAFGVGAQVRVPVASAGPMDFLVLGAVDVATSFELNPGDAKALVSTLRYGLALELWVAKRFTIGFDATNPLVTLSWRSAEDFTGDRATSTSWSAGVIWNPNARFLATLYF